MLSDGEMEILRGRLAGLVAELEGSLRNSAGAAAPVEKRTFAPSGPDSAYAPTTNPWRVTIDLGNSHKHGTKNWGLDNTALNTIK